MERIDQKPRARIIRVESSFDPQFQGTCPNDQEPLVQKQIDYEIKVHGRLWRVPQVWASVCEVDGFTSFEPGVGHAIDDRIFKITFPKQAKIAKLEAELQSGAQLS